MSTTTGKWKRWHKITLITLGSILLLLFIIIAASPDTPQQIAQRRADDSIRNLRAEEDARHARQEQEQRAQYARRSMAFLMSQEFLKKILKAPATAKFPSFEDKFVLPVGDNVYEVRAFVDAENAFSALLRTGYYAKLKYTGNEEWQLIDIKLDE